MSKPRFEDYEFEIRRMKAEDGGGYSITFPDLPGCRSDGETLSEAEENGRDAFDTWMVAWIAEGRDIPQPGERDQSPAKFLQRVPKYVHAQLIDVAREQGVSVNGLVTGFIIAGLERIQMTQATAAVDYGSHVTRIDLEFSPTNPALMGETQRSRASSPSALARWDGRTDAGALAPTSVQELRPRRVHG